MIEPDDWRPVLPETADVRAGELFIGGCRASELADEYGTPLYVYDERTLRAAAREALQAFAPISARVSFASKACSTLAVLKVFSEEGLALDVVSAGELEAGRRAGFRPERIHLHGNAKGGDELAAAVEAGVHAIVLDGADEVERLEGICDRPNRAVNVVLRLSLSIEAETHPYMRTSGRRSKFGMYHPSAEISEVFHRLASSRTLRLMGLHIHLGSQISDSAIYGRAAAELLDVAGSLTRTGIEITEVSLGGGWAVPYRPGEQALSAREVARTIAPLFTTVPSITPAVEPGRALVARAGMALYRVSSVKRWNELRTIAVDGGMGDNLRPALYGAPYSILPAVEPFAAAKGEADIVGRYCESGDFLVRGAALPEVRAGDVLCIPVSGAYHLTMASGYNLVPPPAVVMVGAGDAKLVVRRATIDDLLARELSSERVAPTA